MVTIGRAAGGLIFAALLPFACASTEDHRPTSAAIARGAVRYEDLIGIVDVGVVDVPGGIGVSPDGQLIAVQTRQQDLKSNVVTLRWKIVGLVGDGQIIDAGDGGDPMLYIFRGLSVGDASPEVAVWTPDSQWIVYRAMHDGQTQLWRSRRDGRVQEQLTRNRADVENFRLSGHDQKILFTVGEPRDDIRRAREDQGNRGLLYDGRFAPLYSRNPLPDDTQEYRQVWVYEMTNGKERPATEEEQREFGTLSQLTGNSTGERKMLHRSRSTTVTAWLGDLRPDGPRGVNPPLTVVASRDGSVGGIAVCRARECHGHFKGAWVSDDGAFVYFLRWTGGHEYGSMGIYEWRIGSARVRQILRTEDLLKGCTLEGAHLVCGDESPTGPCRIVTVALSNGDMESTYDPNQEFRKHVFGAVRALHWRDSQGVEGFGHFVEPVGYISGHRYPLIIVQYRSRGFLRGGVGDEQPIQVFASKGFAVLSFQRPDEWELEEEESSYDDVMQQGWVGLHDRRRVLSVLLAGVDLLCDMGVVDSANVGITGMSDGGETVGFALIHAPQRFSAAATSWTPWNPITYYLAGPNMLPMYERFGFGDPLDQATAARWQAVSVALNASRIRAPLLIQVSDSELLGETQTFAEMRREGRPIEMHVFPNEFHVKSQPIQRYYLYKRSVQWFEFWLQGKEAPDPVDPGQYQRWRDLRVRKDSARTAQPAAGSR